MGTVSNLVSVIVSFLNGERFLAEAIESVCAQTYERWELLLIDDGSTDNSASIARGYSARLPDRIFCFQHPGNRHCGLPASRNLGLNKARGLYVALLDADDVWLSHKLEEQVAILEAHPTAALVYGRPTYWHSWSQDPADQGQDDAPELGVKPNSLISGKELLLASYPLGEAATPCPSDILLRRMALEAVQGFEDCFQGPLTLYEDQAFLAKIYLENQVFVADQCWDKYRIHPDSCVATTKKSGHYHEVRKFYFNWLENYLRVRRIEDQGIWRALKRAQLPYRSTGLRRAIEAVKRQAGRFRRSSAVRESAAEASASPPVNAIHFGDLRRMAPISRKWGYDRGCPIDRYYIENFLKSHAGDIRGRVLEIKDDTYTRQFGGDGVARRDVADIDEGNRVATIIADLTFAPNLPSDAFDCIILTQTLQLIYDTRAALRTCCRILRPGGVLLATFPGISKRESGEGADSWYWAFTTHSARRLLEEIFPAEKVGVQAHGNVLAATSFLHGIALEELRQEELDYFDPDYEMLITVRAVKPDPPNEGEA